MDSKLKVFVTTTGVLQKQILKAFITAVAMWIKLLLLFDLSSMLDKSCLFQKVASPDHSN
ncbi:hypothetical protein RhiirA1_477867 [Rhizophagus irregularis]|uniref:Uncharacterized protein n=1 Tax=Rhizophagus irregularis TaxID=588596 RepID=A0A2N0QT13_9GLOM|nr:hypothetical protein RhiirA1_477867 [Rhizophagus irregularis]GET62481.1 hypothetical protein RIR_e43022_A0A2N0QT13_9GLOM [Rhizophagus irregularis DAOM 181602=DAOM 197198]